MTEYTCFCLLSWSNILRDVIAAIIGGVTQVLTSLVPAERNGQIGQTQFVDIKDYGLYSIDIIIT